MKDASTDSQLAAIREVASGGKPFSPEIAKAVNEEHAPDFTDRQRAVLEALMRGLTNRDIATMLNISADAVKQHIAAICAKIGAANRVEAVAIAMKRNMLKF